MLFIVTGICTKLFAFKKVFKASFNCHPLRTQNITAVRLFVNSVGLWFI